MEAADYLKHLSLLATPIVFQVLKDYNLQAEPRGFRAIITGGKALQILLPTVASLRSTDFDVKVVEINPARALHPAHALRGITEAQELTRILARSLQANLGPNLLDFSGYTLRRALDGRQFVEGLTDALCNVFIEAILPGGRVYRDAICDVLYFTWRHPSLQFASREEEDFLTDPDYLTREYMAGGTTVPDGLWYPQGRKGFYRQPFSFHTMEPYLYVATLGYLVHDTVRVLNNLARVIKMYPLRIQDDLIAGATLPDGTHSKYNRYVKKYEHIIVALSSLDYQEVTLAREATRPPILFTQEEFQNRVCQYLRPAVFDALKRYNAAAGGKRAVITGGEALQLLFPAVDAFRTDDYDIKIVPLTPADMPNPADAQNLCNLIAQHCTDYIRNNHIRDGNGIIRGFEVVASPRITNVLYSYTYNGVRHRRATLVDASFYSDNNFAEETFLYYAPLEKGPTNGNRHELLPYYNAGTAVGADRYRKLPAQDWKGFYPETIRHFELETNLYVTTLGCTIFDTVLMLNKSFSYLEHAMGLGDGQLVRGAITGAVITWTDERGVDQNVSLKYMRYISKYRTLINVLTEDRFILETVRDGQCNFESDFLFENPSAHRNLIRRVNAGSEDIIQEIGYLIAHFAGGAPQIDRGFRNFLERLRPETLCNYANQLNTAVLNTVVR